MKSPKKENLISVEEENKTLTKKQSNNHHVVPLGILVVLCTIYLLAAGLHCHYKYYFKPALINRPQLEQHIEPQPTCQKLEIFRKADQKATDNPTPQAKSLKRVRNKNGKHLETARKKDATKKSNTAEPIIYMFALVLIYLLLKAASDINQHYKTQQKGDKRLRRCSLQSYAQAHKQDRRASKVEDAPSLPMLRRKQIVLREARSISMDRYKYNMKAEGICKPTTLPIAALAGDAPVGMNRRCSVPVSIDYQPVKVAAIPYTQTAELVRRGSVISLTGTGLNMPEPTQISDTKRRVRMINRH